MRKISNNSYAIILLCMSLDSDLSQDLKPFTVLEWSKFAYKLLENQDIPSKLFDMSDDELLMYTENDYEKLSRIKKLLNRGNKIGVELSRLSEMGIVIITRADSDYPKLLKQKLLQAAPPLLFCAGNLDLLQSKSAAIVGSRSVEDVDVLVATKLSEKLCKEDYVIVSGGAKGIDMSSEQAALDSGGKVISILSDSLVAKIKKQEVRRAVEQKQILLISTFGYDSHFTVGNAMARNKYIYALSTCAFVVKSSVETGGTWSGVVDSIKHNYSAIFVIEGPSSKSGTNVLAKKYNLVKLSRSMVLENNFDINALIVESEKIKTEEKTEKILQESLPI